MLKFVGVESGLLDDVDEFPTIVGTTSKLLNDDDFGL